mmetsp:Transcript_8093/g.25409  ORF Transcript_8093/g.25409 Transcript_8093/m.25409 type:complete len:431 (+) Transcript_8093:93-1385(+)
MIQPTPCFPSVLVSLLLVSGAALASRRPMDEIGVGYIVQRGEDWEWGEQDGGAGGLGVVVGFQRWRGEQDRTRLGVRVLWKASGAVRTYRWGAQGRYDIQVVGRVTDEERHELERRAAVGAFDEALDESGIRHSGAGLTQRQRARARHVADERRRLAAEGAVASDAVHAHSTTRVVDEAGTVRTDSGLPLHAVELHALRTLFWSTHGPGWKRRRGWESLLGGRTTEAADIGLDGHAEGHWMQQGEASWSRTHGGGRTPGPASTAAHDAHSESDPCLDRWEGVLCLDGHVMSLALPNNNLRGTLPAALGHLVHLRTLVLEHNQLRGPLPPQLRQLARLQFVSLNDNEVEGALDGTLFGAMPELRWLSLHNNALEGAADLSWICTAGHLRRLTLSNNHRLTGTLPGRECVAKLQTLSLLNTGVRVGERSTTM